MSSSRKNINQKASKSVPRALLKTSGGSAQLTATQTTNTQTTNTQTTNTDSNIYLGRNNDRVVQVGDSTFIVETPKDVYVNNYETINNQQYISSNSSLSIEDDGALVTSTASTLNFTGSGVSAVLNGDTVDVTITGGGGGGTPGGSNTQVQYNAGGSFSGASGLTYNSTNSSVGMTNITPPTGQGLTINLASTVSPMWFALYGDLGTNAREDYSSQVVHDSQGNIIVCGADGDMGIPFIVKYDLQGQIVWQRNLTETNNYYKVCDTVAVDGSNNIYTTVFIDDAISDTIVVKLNSNGVIQWQKQISFTNYSYPTDITVDNNSNVYVAGTTLGGPFIIKMDSSGNIIWKKQLDTISSISGIDVSISDNIYVLGTTNSSLDAPSVIVKMDTAGNIVWSKGYLNGVESGNNAYSGQIVVDSAENSYICGRGQIVSTNNFSGYVSKVDSTGNIVWQLNIEFGINTYGRLLGIDLDQYQNIYVTGYGNSYPMNGIYVAKISNTGTLMWQRMFSSGSDYLWWYNGVTPLSVFGDTYSVSGYSYPSDSAGMGEALVMNFLTDGTGTGQYRGYTYSVATFSTNTVQFDIFAPGVVATILSSTVVDGDLTADVATQTNTLVNISGGSNSFTFGADGRTYFPYYNFPLASGSSGSVLVIDGNGDTSWKPARLYLDGKGSAYIVDSATDPNLLTAYHSFIVGQRTSAAGYYNTSIGFYAGGSNGNSNVSIGNFAGNSLNGGNDNNFLGSFAGCSNTVGTSNNFFGGSAGQKNTTGGCNNFFGMHSGGCNTIGSSNNYFGYFSGRWGTSSSNNNFFGSYAGYNNLGNNNNFFGYQAGFSNTTGAHNNFFGCWAGHCNTSGQHNNFFGWQAGYCNTTGYVNNFFGLFAGFRNTTGCNNNFFGQEAGWGNTEGYENNFFGRQAGYFNTTGSYNNFFGSLSGHNNTTGNCNNFFGRRAGYFNTTGNYNNFLGSLTGFYNTTGSFNNFIGHRTGFYNTTGSFNSFYGSNSGQKNTVGCDNTFIGHSAGQENTSGNFNSFFGAVAGLCNTNGCLNTFIGYAAGGQNTNGSNNILIGQCAGTTIGVVNGLANITTQSNRIILGNASHTCAQIQVAWTVVSDCRDKHIYCRLDKGRGFLEKIEPIVYSFKDRETNEIRDPKKRYGFSAQEILNLEGDDPVIVGTENPDKLGMTHEYLIPIMINAIKELNIENKALRADVDLLKELLKSTNLPNTTG